MTLEALAARVDLHHSHLSRLEKGSRLLMIPVAEKIARELGYSPQEVMGYDHSVALPNAGATGGLQEEFAPYLIKPGDPLATLQTGSTYLFTARSNALNKAGILFGDVLEVSDDAGVCKNPSPLAAVRVRWHPPDQFMKPLTLLRQFVPPRLLITNSIADNARQLDMDEADAHIVGVVVGIHRRSGGALG